MSRAACPARPGPEELLLTPEIFAQSCHVIGPGYDIEPLLRLSHLTDTFLYTNLFLSMGTVLRWYERQFAGHPDIEVLGRKIVRDFDERRHFLLHPDYQSHLMAPLFAEKEEEDRYQAAFGPALALPTYAVVWDLHRPSLNRRLRLYYITAEGLATYLLLSQNGVHAPRILITIRTGVLEDPRGPMNHYLCGEDVQEPDLWIRGFMPDLPDDDDDDDDEEGASSCWWRRHNHALDPVGRFSRPAMSFNHQWRCGRFQQWDDSNDRYCRGFVTPEAADRLQGRAVLAREFSAGGRHQLIQGSIGQALPRLGGQDLLVLPRRLARILEADPSRCIFWDDLAPPRHDCGLDRNIWPEAREQVRLLGRELARRGKMADRTLHLVPWCMEDEGREYFRALRGLSQETRTYVTGLLDFIDVREKPAHQAEGARAIHDRPWTPSRPWEYAASPDLAENSLAG